MGEINRFWVFIFLESYLNDIAYRKSHLHIPLINSGALKIKKNTVLEIKESDLLCFKNLCIATKQYFIQTNITEMAESRTTFIIN